MIDLSDGLSTDLAHICEESGVGAEIQSGAIPRASIGKPARPGRSQLALHGGDDYELLFTAPSDKCVPTRIAGVAITQIGHITRGKQVMLMNREGRRLSSARKAGNTSEELLAHSFWPEDGRWKPAGESKPEASSSACDFRATRTSSLCIVRLLNRSKVSLCSLDWHLSRHVVHWPELCGSGTTCVRIHRRPSPRLTMTSSKNNSDRPAP